jgi:uncharacterized membrane protein
MENNFRWLEKTGLVILVLLFFIWPIPRTISLRDLLLVFTLCVFGYLAWRRGEVGRAIRDIAPPIGILMALTIWMYVVAFFISPETSWALDEIQSQWLRGLASLAAGILIAAAAKPRADLGRQVLLAVFIALLVHVVYVDAMALYQWPQDWRQGGDFTRITGFAGGSDKSNYVTNTLFCFVFADLLIRRLRGKNLMPVGNGVLWAALVLTLFSMFAERMRNGVTVFVLLLVATALFYLLGRKSRISKTASMMSAAAMLVIALGGFALAVFIKPTQNTISVRNLLDTTAIAWDTENHKAWQDEKKYGLPTLPSGETVDPSLYQRVAWFKQGLLLVAEHPLGVGFGRNAFGHGLKAKYGEGGGHSHSGMLDFTIGTGVPGTLLWLAFLASLAVPAYRRYRAAHDAVAALLLLLLLDFGARMFLDSVIRDHMLQQFMLLVGFASVIMTRGTQEKERSSA